MPIEARVKGIAIGSVDVDRRDVHFTLVKNDGTTLQCVGEFTATAQITAALAQMLSSLRTRVNKKPATVPIAKAPVPLASSHSSLDERGKSRQIPESICMVPIFSHPDEFP